MPVIVVFTANSLWEHRMNGNRFFSIVASLANGTEVPVNSNE
jgi:hypothetical protein